MSDENNKDLILEILKEIKEDQKEFKKTATTHRDETLQWQGETSSRLVLIEKDLRDHKEGVINNRKLIQVSDKRLRELEKPIEATSTLINGSIKLGKIIGAATVIGGLVITIAKTFIGM